MKFKNLSKRLKLVIIFFILALACVLIFFVIQRKEVSTKKLISESVVVQPLQVNTISGMPVRLKIPMINVDAAVEQVGLTTGGLMDVPSNFLNVGWYNLGKRPGEIGSAVMDGHYGLVKGKASVFDNLYKLNIGDKIYIEDDKGETVSFVVSLSRSYAPDADASEVFISNDGKAHLNIITCEGTWNKDTKSYSERLVVFADQE